ncbi:MAG: hypothetical protein ACK4XJ_00615 [Fimbriimonadaceae bacterium]
MTALFVCASLIVMPAFSPAGEPQANQVKGSMVAYPWAFTNGTDTARETAVKAVQEVFQKANYSILPQGAAERAWKSLQLPTAQPMIFPNQSQLQRFARAMEADFVAFGSVNWHTRSIWVGMGPKTISTATVDLYVYDRKANRVVYTKEGVEGRSDEQDTALRVLAPLLISPFIAPFTGGPATPREQRAVQIAVARAAQGFVGKK